MARAFILSPKISDAGTITASNSVSNAVASNLLLARPKLYWRSTSTTPYLECNLGSARAINTLVLGYINAKSADTFRLRLATSQGNLTASPAYDSTALSIWPSGSDLSAYDQIHRVFALPSTQTYQWYRIDFGFGSNPAGYVQASRVIVGSRIEPVVSVQSKWAISSSEEITETIDMGGEESPRGSGSKRSMSVTWHDLKESEKESLYTTLLERGSSKDIVLAIEPSEGAYAMSRVFIGRVRQALSFQQTMLVGDRANPEHHFTVSLTVSEMAPIEMA